MSNDELDEYYGMDGELIMAVDDPEPERLLGEFLISGETVMIFAAGGTGKTMLTLAIAVAVASGGDALDWHAEKAQPVLYIDGEMKYNEMKKRLKVITGDGTIPKNFILLNHSKLPQGEYIDISDIKFQNRILTTLLFRKAKLLIIDNLSCLMKLENENDAYSWTIIERFYKKLNNMGITVILLHHPSRKAEDPRGSTRKDDSVDTCIQLKSSKEQPHHLIGGPAIEMKFIKSRNNPSLNKATKEFVFVASSGKWVTKKEFKKIEGEHQRF